MYSDAEIEALERHEKRQPLSDSQMQALESAQSKAPLNSGFQRKSYTNTGAKQTDTDVQENHSDPHEVDNMVRSALDGVTGGFADKAASAIGTAVPWLNRTPAEIMEGKPVEKKTYVQNRDQLAPVYEKAVADHPVANVVGSMAMPLPGATTAKGMMGVGALAGGINALGHSKADLTKGEYGKAAIDTGIGAGIGGAAAGALGFVGTKLGGLAKKFSGERALKAAGAIQKDLKKIPAAQQEALAEELLNQNTIGWFDKAENVGEKVKAIRDVTGDKLGKLYEGLDAAAGDKGFDVGKAVSRIDNNVVTPLANHPESAKYIPTMEEKLDELLSTAGDRTSFANANALKGGYDSHINYNRQSQKMDMADLIKSLRNGLRDEIGDQAAQISPAKSQELKSLNSTYGKMSAAMDLAEGGANREHGNNLLGNVGKLATVLGAGGAIGGGLGKSHGHDNGQSTVDGLAGAAVTGVLTSIATARGDAFAARVASSAAKFLQNPTTAAVLAQAAKRGPQAFMAWLHTLQAQDAQEQPNGRP